MDKITIKIEEEDGTPIEEMQVSGFEAAEELLGKMRRRMEAIGMCAGCGQRKNKCTC